MADPYRKLLKYSELKNSPIPDADRDPARVLNGFDRDWTGTRDGGATFLSRPPVTLANYSGAKIVSNVNIYARLGNPAGRYGIRRMDVRRAEFV